MADSPPIICYLDTETTGLNPFLHEPWEVGLILTHESIDEPVEKRWFLPVDHLEWAEPQALEVGHFFNRYDRENLTNADEFCRDFMKIVRGATIVGVNPGFDREMLNHLFFRHGAVATWHYEPVDVVNLIAGRYRKKPPWKSHQISRLVGVNPDSFERHSALGDCRWTMAMYNAVYAPPREPANDANVGADVAQGGLLPMLVDDQPSEAEERLVEQGASL